MKRRIVVALALVPLMGLPALAAPFADVGGQLAIDAAALGKRSILPPVWGDSTLAPDAPVYRYEEAWMLAALLDPKDSSFIVVAWPDVPPGYWALQAVNQVVGVGILHDENGRFDGDRTISEGEFVEALDDVLRYRAIPPPPPTIGRLGFPGLTGPMLAAADQAANRWQIIRLGDNFEAHSVLTRGEAVRMLARAAPLVDPSFAQLLVPPPTPTPQPTPTPGGLNSFFAPTPAPTTAQAPTPAPAAATPVAPSTDTLAPTPQPAGSAAPEADWTPPPIAWRWQVEPVLATLGLADSTILAANPAFGLPGGADLDLIGTTGPIQATIRAGTHLLLSGGSSGISGLYQIFGSGEGLWMLPLAQDAEAGLGGGLVLNSQSVAGSAGSAPNAGRTFFGIGPAGLLRYGLGFATLDLGLQLQAGGISGASGGGGFGLGYQIQAYGPIGLGSLQLTAGVRGQLVDSMSGPYDFVSGLVAGIGANF